MFLNKPDYRKARRIIERNMQDETNIFVFYDIMKNLNHCRDQYKTVHGLNENISHKEINLSKNLKTNLDLSFSKEKNQCIHDYSYFRLRSN